MDQLRELSSRGTCLLTLPRSDLDAGAASCTGAASDDHGDGDALVLLQLPLGWSAADLRGARFVAPEGAPAALVSEHRRTSFDVQRVETSNVLVLVPPPPPTPSAAEAEAAEVDAPASPDGPSKRPRVLRPVPARLLKRGGSGASFLELRPRPLSWGSVERRFHRHRHVYDPLHHAGHAAGAAPGAGCAATAAVRGLTVPALAAQLQVSEAQVARVVAGGGGATDPDGPAVPAAAAATATLYYPLPDTTPTAYVVLAEEAALEAFQAILAALAEAAPFADYVSGDVSRYELVEQALERFSGDGLQCLPGGARGLIAFCVDHLAANGADTDSTDIHGTATASDRIRLDVGRVAVIVARQLFQRQTTPWEETRLLARWQAELPGVGEGYRVETSMLRGMAVSFSSKNNDDNEIYWKYLPPRATPPDPVAAFAAIFDVKQKWLMEELRPYLDYWADTCGSSQEDLLLRFTKSVTEEQEGASVNFLIRKQ